MKIFIISLLLSAQVLGQSAKYSSGKSKLDFIEEKKEDKVFDTYIITRPSPTGQNFQVYRCIKDECLKYEMKLQRGADTNWTLSTSQSKGTDWLKNPAKVTGDELNVISFSSWGKDNSGMSYTLGVNFFATGSHWKTKIFSPDGKLISTVSVILSDSDQKTFETALKGKTIHRQ